MKKSILLMACALIASTFATAQLYFYGDNGVLNLNPDPNSQVIHFENHNSYQNFLAKAPFHWSIVKQIEKYNLVIIESLESFPTHLNDLPEFAQLNVRSQIEVLRLDDGFGLWLGYEMLFEPIPGFESEIESIVNSFNGKLHLDTYGMYSAELPDPLATLTISNELVELGLVNWAHPNFYANHSKKEDPLYIRQFQLHNTGQTIDGEVGVNDIDCDAPEAWAISTGSESLIVAVIDDGVEEHEDIYDANGISRKLPGHTPATNGDGTPVGTNRHGMACAGIIAASHNDIGVRGVAPLVKILPIDIFQGSETTADLAEAFNWARLQGADVMSNSWGYNSCSLTLPALSSAIVDAATTGRGGLGSVLLFASGNTYSSCVEYPGDINEVMAVGAVTSLGEIANYSNQGPALDIVAPSNSAPGQAGAGVSTTDRPGSAGYSSGNYTNTFGGTSAACPVVAGVAALVLSVDQTLTRAQVSSILENSATDMGTSGFDNTFGHGLVNAHDALLLANPAPEDCSEIISNFPFQEGFESEVYNWVQSNDDDLDWIINSGETSSSNTGPSAAFEGNEYLYIEASSPNYPLKSGIITSPCFDLTSITNPELSFACHMYGAAMGSIQVEASTNSGQNWTTLWTLEGDQGNAWFNAIIDLAGFSNALELKFRITATTGSNQTGDLAIDNIEIHENTGSACGDIVNLFPYSEGFENTNFSWEQATDDNLNWTANSGSTTSSNTGPSEARSGANYLYLEASSPNYPAKVGGLNSPCFDLSGSSNPELSFAYHMYGSSMGTLQLEASVDGGQNWNPLWTVSGDQGNLWNDVVLDLTDYSNETALKLRFIGTTGTDYTSDIAIDNINLSEMPISNCHIVTSSSPYAESFESAEFNWHQINNDDTDWIRNSGDTPSMNTGPTAANAGSYYMHIEASSPNYPTKTAILESDCFDFSSLTECYMSFDHHLYGAHIGTLLVQAKSGNGDWQTLWNRSGNQGNNWKTSQIDLTNYAGENEVTLRFHGTTGIAYYGDISIDNIQIDATSFEPDLCPIIDFTSNSVSSYGFSQDQGDFDISENGSRLNINNNAWKSIDFDYAITPNTMLSFEFKSSAEGEIHGIGFDNDNNISFHRTFQVHGTQSWGILNYNNYSGSDWVIYHIPVGNVYTGNFNRLIFAGDNDAGPIGDNSSFKNISVYESSDCDAFISTFDFAFETAILGTEREENTLIKLFPNPTQGNLSLISRDLENGHYTLSDITGKILLSQNILNPNMMIDLEQLSNGIYLIQIKQGGVILETHKIVKSE